MSGEELDRIDRLAAAATPGPWFAHDTDDALCMNVYCVTTSPLEPIMDGTPDRPYDVEYADVVALTLFSEPRLVSHASGKFSEDTAFIAAARTAVPELIAEVRRARADLSAAQAVVRSLAERVKAQSDLLAKRAALARLDGNEAVLAAVRAERERAVGIVTGGRFCRYADHAQGVCDCREMADAIRHGVLGDDGIGPPAAEPEATAPTGTRSVVAAVTLAMLAAAAVAVGMFFSAALPGRWGLIGMTAAPGAVVCAVEAAREARS